MLWISKYFITSFSLLTTRNDEVLPKSISLNGDHTAHNVKGFNQFLEDGIYFSVSLAPPVVSDTLDYNSNRLSGPTQFGLLNCPNDTLDVILQYLGVDKYTPTEDGIRDVVSLSAVCKQLHYVMATGYLNSPCRFSKIIELWIGQIHFNACFLDESSSFRRWSLQYYGFRAFCDDYILLNTAHKYPCYTDDVFLRWEFIYSYFQTITHHLQRNISEIPSKNYLKNLSEITFKSYLKFFVKGYTLAYFLPVHVTEIYRNKIHTLNEGDVIFSKLMEYTTILQKLYRERSVITINDSVKIDINPYPTNGHGDLYETQCHESNVRQVALKKLGYILGTFPDEKEIEIASDDPNIPSKRLLLSNTGNPKTYTYQFQLPHADLHFEDASFAAIRGIMTMSDSIVKCFFRSNIFEKMVLGVLTTVTSTKTTTTPYPQGYLLSDGIRQFESRKCTVCIDTWFMYRNTNLDEDRVNTVITYFPLDPVMKEFRQSIKTQELFIMTKPHPLRRLLIRQDKVHRESITPYLIDSGYEHDDNLEILTNTPLFSTVHDEYKPKLVLGCSFPSDKESTILTVIVKSNTPRVIFDATTRQEVSGWKTCYITSTAAKKSIVDMCVGTDEGLQ